LRLGFEAGPTGDSMHSVWLLAMTQALCNSGTFLVVLLGGILGSQLAPRPALATLPLSVMIIGLALTAFPAALIMQRLGRRPVFQATALVAAGAAVLGAQAIRAESFGLFCLATFLLGTTNAVVMQYRFAAAEHVAPELAGRAVATVMVGALVDPRSPYWAPTSWPTRTTPVPSIAPPRCSSRPHCCCQPCRGGAARSGRSAGPHVRWARWLGSPNSGSRSSPAWWPTPS